jgi:hypothetical protein
MALIIRKRKSEPDSPSPKTKTNFAKKLKVAKAYVAKIEQQAKECDGHDSDEDSGGPLGWTNAIATVTCLLMLTYWSQPDLFTSVYLGI